MDYCFEFTGMTAALLRSPFGRPRLMGCPLGRDDKQH